MLFLVEVALLAIASGTELTCTMRDAQGGRKQVWVPNCQGEGCFANGVDWHCAWCVYDMNLCSARYELGQCKQILSDRRAQNVGCFDVGRGSYAVAGYGCKGNETLIFYPVGEGLFPVVVYGHGFDPEGTLDNRMEAMAHVATNGLLVIAPNTGAYDGKGGTCSSTSEWKDLILAARASREGGASLHHALATASWDRIGMWGYSMGGKTVPLTAVQHGLNIHAMVAEHGARHSVEVAVPSFYLTSTLDESSSPAHVMQEEFRKNNARCKVFTNLKNADHFEPVNNGSQNIWIAKFLACHLGKSSLDCSNIYGEGPDSLCRAGGEYADCIFVRKHSSCSYAGAESPNVIPSSIQHVAMIEASLSQVAKAEKRPLAGSILMVSFALGCSLIITPLCMSIRAQRLLGDRCTRPDMHFLPVLTRIYTRKHRLSNNSPYIRIQDDQC